MKPKYKHPRRLRILLTLVLLGVAACLWEFVSSQNPYILPAKRSFKYDVLHVSPVDIRAETSNLMPSPGGASCTFYTDGEESAGYARGRDNKAVWHSEQAERLVNYLDGYQLDFPVGAQFDFSLSPLYTRASGEGWDAVVSRERATYAGMKDVISFELSTFFPFLLNDGVQRYVNHYEWRFLTDETWQQENRVAVEQSEYWAGGRLTEQFLTATVREPGDLEYDSYLFAIVYTRSREYLRIAVRFHSEDRQTPDWFRDSIRLNLRVFDPAGAGHYDTDYFPDLDAARLSAEARALYDELANGDTLKWGIFTADSFTDLENGSVAELERELDYTFDAALVYIHFGKPFPTEFMEANRKKGRVVELTYQVTENNNENMFAHTPFLDICRGECDDTIRSFARAAAAYGHPFLFRLNNEMNSDWTSYSGVVNLADPQLYAAVWQRFYRIFREEGADNCLWIYNPNDRSAPPGKWNDSLAYWPGNESVQLLGVTGYNNGTYYAQWNEQWRDFKTIYDEIRDLYFPHFSRFPWVITEFASSSYGGDKVKWIAEMFAHLGDYPNIKLAVWFNAADYDGDVPARPYWLDETPETLAAFRRGLHGES